MFLSYHYFNIPYYNSLIAPEEVFAPGGQGEVRAVISLDTFVLSEHEISVLDQVSFTGEQIDPNDFPGMIGYIVQPGDNLWSIAKKYRMSIERIREVNQDNTKAAGSFVRNLRYPPC